MFEFARSCNCYIQFKYHTRVTLVDVTATGLFSKYEGCVNVCIYCFDIEAEEEGATDRPSVYLT
jgi:hypothetical protein